MITEVLALARERGGEWVRTAIAGPEMLASEELADRHDHGLFGPASVAWRVHGDTSMLIGGLRALLFQTLHPLAMAGVADHSDYRHDPGGRLHRTARFVGATTYGSTATAERHIAAVRAVHERVTGTAPDGRPYAANDPHLLLWVHATEVDSFLAAYDRYGSGHLTDAERDRYVAEMAGLAIRLGVEDPPRDRAALAACLDGYRSECAVDRRTREAVNFLLVAPVSLWLQGPYQVIAAASTGLLPPWARRMLHLPLPPGLEPLAIRPAATVVTRTIGWLVTDRPERDRDDRLLTV